MWEFSLFLCLSFHIHTHTQSVLTIFNWNFQLFSFWLMKQVKLLLATPIFVLCSINFNLPHAHIVKMRAYCWSVIFFYSLPPSCSLPTMYFVNHKNIRKIVPYTEGERGKKDERHFTIPHRTAFAIYFNGSSRKILCGTKMVAKINLIYGADNIITQRKSCIFPVYCVWRFNLGADEMPLARESQNAMKKMSSHSRRD